MTTKLRNPHYPPEVSVKVSLLNFFVTSEGLEEQLLGTVVTQVNVGGVLLGALLFSGPLLMSRHAPLLSRNSAVLVDRIAHAVTWLVNAWLFSQDVVVCPPSPVQERPDLANIKSQLVVSNARMKKELKDIEDKILSLLSNSQVGGRREGCQTGHLKLGWMEYGIVVVLQVTAAAEVAPRTRQPPWSR
jgi:hypothetical protein